MNLLQRAVIVGTLLGSAAVGPLLSGCSDCSCGSKQAKPTAAKEPHPAAPLPRPARRPAAGPASEVEALPPPSPARRVSLPITPEEVKATLPQVPGATFVGESSVLPTTNQVKSTMCIAEPDLELAAGRVAKSLEGDGWSEVHVRAATAGMARYAIGGRKGDYRLTGSVQHGNWPECPQAEGKSIVALSTSKVIGPTMGPGGEPVPRGLPGSGVGSGVPADPGRRPPPRGPGEVAPQPKPGKPGAPGTVDGSGR